LARASSKKRPLVETAIRTEFGDVVEDSSFHDVGGSDRDLSYVPGFSDMRRARDREVADVTQGRKRATPALLPVNVRWVRAADLRGAPDARKQIGASNLGYRKATKDDIGEDWLKELPPGAQYDAEGAIRKGDVVLMVASGEQAARNAARKAVATDRMQSDAAAAAGGLLDAGGKKEGVDPYVRQE
jgi:hypothetical protein